MVSFKRTPEQCREITEKLIGSLLFKVSTTQYLDVATVVSNGDTDYCQQCYQTGTLFVVQPPNLILTDRCMCQIALTSKQNIDAMFAVSNIPIKYRNFKIADWKDPGRNTDEILANQRSISAINTYVNRIDDMIAEGNGLFLCGPSGVGKTLLACAIGSHAIEHGHEVRFFTLAKIISLTVSGWYEDDQRRRYIEEVEKIPLLIVDDCDKIYHTKTGLETALFDNMFRERVQNNRPVIFTSNQTVTDAKQTFNNAIYSLFLEHVLELVIQGEDYRKKISADLKKKILG